MEHQLMNEMWNGEKEGKSCAHALKCAAYAIGAHIYAFSRTINHFGALVQCYFYGLILCFMILWFCFYALCLWQFNISNENINYIQNIQF